MNNVFKVVLIALVWAAGNITISKFFGFISKKNGKIHINFAGSAAKMVWAIMAAVTITDMFTATKNLSQTILTSSALLVAVLGFAAQEVLADVISGLMLSWSRPFDVGEKIAISELGISGIVESMTIRHTVIRTYHNSRLLVPNSIINKSVIENSNYGNEYVGNYLEVPVNYGDNTERAIEIMEEVISSNPFVMEVGKKASVLIKDFEENGVVLKCTIYTKDVDSNFIACSDIRREIKKRFDAEGIRIHCRRMRITS